MHDFSATIAQKILRGFDKHYKDFQYSAQQAKIYLLNRQWAQLTKLSQDRICYYDNSVKAFCHTIKKTINIVFDENLWIETKSAYSKLIYNHNQPELAETFYNSVFCRLFDKKFYNNDYIFVKPGKSTTFIDMDDPVIFSYYLTNRNIKKTFCQVLVDIMGKSYSNLMADVDNLVAKFKQQLNPLISDYFEIEIINTLFIRRRAAYIVGKIVSKSNITKPLIIAINNNNNKKGIYADALITDTESASIIFSFSRSYFFVNTKYPAAIVDFLKAILPNKSKVDLYSAIGLHKHGKTLLYRKFLKYSRATKEKLIAAPGIKGMVMTVFTFPMFPYVFKTINDKFARPKNTTKQKVKDSYFFIKNHGRIGRLADTWEFSDVAFSLKYIDKKLLKELQTKNPSNISIERGLLIVKHLYIETKMIPLDIFLKQATNKDEIKSVVIDYGRAIDELINSNIFPGDMLPKNFGVTRQNRIVFYDYDEILTMDVPVFRTIPKPRNQEDEFSSEPWYHVGDNDVFPEEFKFFIFADKENNDLFCKHYKKLLDANYWNEIQQNIIKGDIKDYCPYKEEHRLLINEANNE